MPALPAHLCFLQHTARGLPYYSLSDDDSCWMVCSINPLYELLYC